MTGRKTNDDRPWSDSTKWRRLRALEDMTTDSETSDAASTSLSIPSSPRAPALLSPSSSAPQSPNPSSGPLPPSSLSPLPGPPSPFPLLSSPSPPPDDSPHDSDHSSTDFSNSSYELVPDENIENEAIPDNILRIKEFLCNWSLSHGGTLNSLTDLCRGLKDLHPECFSTLPVDARTILGTPQGTYPIIVVPPGEYAHIGIRFQLSQILKLCPAAEPGDCLSLFFNIDGLPLKKSSHSQFYVISVFFPCLILLRGRAYPVGIYHGRKKPMSFETFLRPFIDEIKELLENGFFYEGRIITVNILGFACDAPAKSDVLGIIGHTGYFSCTRCVVEGETHGGTRVFADLTCALRTDADFRNRADPNFRPIGRSAIITEIPGLNITAAFTLDPMHLIFLGVTKTMLEVWTSSGVRRHQLSAAALSSISEFLIQSRVYLPCELTRRPRELDSVLKWKATEFSTFLLYLGPVIMKDHLSPEKYSHLISLHIPTTILMCAKYCIEERKRRYARELLVWFVGATVKLYGKSMITHNFHGLIHLTDDADHFSQLIPLFSLYVISAFPSEHLLGLLKKLIRGPSKPLQQAIRRLMELTAAKKKFYKPPVDGEITYSDVHREGPLLALCRNPQYKTINYPDFKISVSREGDSYCQLNDNDGAIVKVENIAHDNEENKVIIGKQLTDPDNFYPDDFFGDVGSAALGIVKGRHFSVRRYWKISSIGAKVFAVPRPGHDEKMSGKHDANSLWTIVWKKDEEEFDAVPNSWLIDHSLTYYPNKNKTVATRYARNVEEPVSDWDELEVTIDHKHRNYESFDKALEDARRFTQGNKSKSESEKEMKGRGQRSKKKPRKYDSSSSESSESSQLESDESVETPVKKTKKRKSRKKSSPAKKLKLSSSPISKLPSYMRHSPRKSTTERMSSQGKTPPGKKSLEEMKSTVQNTSLEKSLGGEVSPEKECTGEKVSPEKECTGEKVSPEKECTEQNKSSETKSLPKETVRIKKAAKNLFSVKRCRLSKNHYCVFSDPHIELSTLAMALCHLSRNMELLKYYFRKNTAEIMEKLEELSSASPHSDEPDEISDGEDLEDDTKVLMPFKSLESLMQFDKTIDDNLFKKIVCHFRKEATYGRVNSMARSILSLIMDVSLFRHFSWTGAGKKGQKKNALTRLKLFKALQSTVQKSYGKRQPDYRTKIKKTLKAYLSQKKTTNVDED